jgi:cation-transporting P-type ATPase J
MPATLTAPPTTISAPATRTRWRGVAGLVEVRWAAVATLLFAVGGVAQLAGAPAGVWWACYLACYAAGGWEPGLAGLRALAARRLDVDLLMIVAAVIAAAIGQVFDGALLIVIFATSGALEAVATHRTAESVRALLDLTPQTATRLDADGGERIVSVAELAVGDVVLVRPGDQVGADGLVTDGASEVDQASITGESLPVVKQPGDEVFAGTVNGTGALRVRVDREAGESVLARIVALVEEASATKARTQLFIETVEQRYSLAVVAATLTLFLVPLALGAALQPTLLRAMTFMIVASPCAVVLATMPPLLAAIANAGRHGVLVKSAVVMEHLATVDRVAFDKTGTLTEGTPRVTAVHPLSDWNTAQLLRVAAAAERPSEHPIAAAIVAAAHAQHLHLPDPAQFDSAPGRGVRARVEGYLVEVGAPALLDHLGDAAAAECARAALIATGQAGQTCVVVLIDQAPAGVLGLADQPRAAAAVTVGALTRLTGHAPLLLTGDNHAAATTLADSVGIDDVHAGLLPQDKVSLVHAAQADGVQVLVVGDGVNDAPALAAADLGVAMGRAGSDLALETADAVIVRDDLTTLPRLLALGRRARRLVTANLIIAAAVIIALVIWDLAGYLPLPLGVAGHETSTVIVGLNGLRLLPARAWRRSARDVLPP